MLRHPFYIDIISMTSQSQPALPKHQLQDTEFQAYYSTNTNESSYALNHRIDFFAIIWFEADGDNHYIDFKPYPIKRNTAYLLARNQIHSLPSPSPAKVIIFSKAFFDSIREDELRFLFVPLHNDGIIIPDSLQQQMEYLFELILTENKSNNDDQLLHLYISAFLLQLHRLNRQSDSISSEHHEPLHKLFILLGEYCKKEKRVEFYADKVGLTAKRLNQIVKERTDLSLSQLIYNYVLIEAKREITHGTKSMKEIAIELGFSSQSYFSRFFKKQTGITPELFRH